VFFYEVRCAHN